MALTKGSTYEGVFYDFVLDGVRDLFISEFNNTKVYINGVLSQEQTRTGAMGSDNNPNRIGSYSNSGGGGNSGWDMNGNIGPTKVYNRALSAGDVLQNYQAQKERFGF